MFWAIWNYLRGYVIIGVYGFSVEKFINLAAYKGIYLWDIKPYGAGVKMKVSIKGFKKLRQCGVKTKCRYRIIEKYGLPFKSYKYKKRKFLSGGVFFFVLALYILSSFIWIVDVEGNERIKQETIKEFCGDIGLKAGGLKYGMDTKEIADKLLSGFDDIAWVSVNIKGTKAVVKVVETVPKAEIKDYEDICDIVAEKDGIITNIATSAGTPKVRENDAVKAGDILVSSEVEIKEGEEVKGKRYVKAKSEVTAKLWYDFKEELSKQYSEKIYTDEEYTDTSIIISDDVFNFIKPNTKGKEYEVLNIYEKYFKIGDYTFPFGIIKNKYVCFEEVQKERTTEECTLLLEKALEEKINLLEAEGIDILSIDKNIDDLESRTVIEARITVLERIDKQSPVHIDEGSTVDDRSGETD